MGVTLQAWLSALLALLPPGRAFSRESASLMSRLLEGLAAQLLTAQIKLESLVAQFDPSRATSMLPDWERLLGLPDPCSPAGMQQLDRQRAAYQRLVEQGGQSRAYFINLATLLGEPGCTITEFAPMRCTGTSDDALYSPADIFSWRLNIPRPALAQRFSNCDSPCDAALQMYIPSSVECAIRARKPAHTHVIFGYTA